MSYLLFNLFSKCKCTVTFFEHGQHSYLRPKHDNQTLYNKACQDKIRLLIPHRLLRQSHLQQYHRHHHRHRYFHDWHDGDEWGFHLQHHH